MSSAYFGTSTSYEAGITSSGGSYSGPQIQIPQIAWKDCHTWDLKIGFIAGRGIPILLGMAWNGMVSITKIEIVNSTVRACANIFRQIFTHIGNTLTRIWEMAQGCLNDLYMRLPDCRTPFTISTDWIHSCCAKVAACFTSVYNAIVNTASAFHAMVSPYLPDLNALNRVCQALGITALVGLRNLLNSAYEGLASIANRIKPYLPNIDSIIQDCVVLCTPIWNATVGAITEFFRGIGDRVASFCNNCITPIIPYIQACLNDCAEKLNDLATGFFNHFLVPVREWGIRPLIDRVLSPVSTSIGNIIKAFFSGCCRTHGMEDESIDESIDESMDELSPPPIIPLDAPLRLQTNSEFNRICRSYRFLENSPNKVETTVTEGNRTTTTCSGLKTDVAGEEDYTFTTVDSFENDEQGNWIAGSDFYTITKHLKAE